MTIETCPDCGWQSKPTTPGRAAYALRLHSCDRHRRLVAQRERGEARRTVDRTPKPCLHPRANHQHGHYVTYHADKCRCRPCTDAAVRQMKAHRLRTSRGHAALVDAAPAQDHVRALIAAGMSLSGVRRAAGWASRNMLREVMTRPRITPATEARILAVTPDDDADFPGHLVDATDTRRRVRELNKRMTHAQIAEAVGATRDAISDLSRGRRATTRRGTAVAVETLWERVLGGVHVEDVEWLMSQDAYTWQSLADRLGCSVGQVRHKLTRADRTDLIAELWRNTDAAAPDGRWEAKVA